MGIDPVSPGFPEALSAINPVIEVQAGGRLPLKESEETFRLRMAVRELRVPRLPVRELMLTSRTWRPRRAEYPEGIEPVRPSPLTLRYDRPVSCDQPEGKLPPSPGSFPKLRVDRFIKTDQAAGRPPVRPGSFGICREVSRESVDQDEGMDPW